jgi:hypothetical protein
MNDIFAPIQDAPSWIWFIDIGPFLDRFGPAMLPMLMSTEPVVAASVKNMMARKWIDLERDDVAAVLSYAAGVTIPASARSQYRSQEWMLLE